MGIRNLNRFLKDNASNSIRFCKLKELANKKIAVDVSIYMYRFLAEGTLIENMYLMISVFRYYNIIPIFIFDGKPPPEKNELIKKRKYDKKCAEQEYKQLKEKLELNTDMDEIDRQDVISNMDLLKKKFVSVHKSDIENVKLLIEACGATYYEAPGEADDICSWLVIKNKVWACLSEDMDMFVYGCPRVIRYLSLLNHTAVVYDVKGILSELNITQQELRDICVLSGTDYNTEGDDNNDLEKTLKYFKKYKKSKVKCSFYEWLNVNYPNTIKDYELLLKINEMFDIHNKCYNIKMFDKIKICNGCQMKNELEELLKSDGFLFP